VYKPINFEEVENPSDGSENIRVVVIFLMHVARQSMGRHNNLLSMGQGSRIWWCVQKYRRFVAQFENDGRNTPLRKP
jgi:hypothetical protein